MSSVIGVLAVACFTWVGSPSDLDGGSLIEAMDSLQPALRDFQCEFEGTFTWLNDDAKKKLGLDATGVERSFGGTFIWQRGGNIYSNALIREEPSGVIKRWDFRIRPTTNEAEDYVRDLDQPLGAARIRRADTLEPQLSASYTKIFPIEDLKRLVRSKMWDFRVSDETVDGHALKVLTVLVASTESIFERYWIDLERGGNVVRRESYTDFGKKRMGHSVITLKSFPVDGETVWMPISAVSEGYANSKDGKPMNREILYVNEGTFRFNVNPPARTFTTQYDPGTPVTDTIRKLQYQFGQQKWDNPIKAEAEALLKEQLALAEKQKKELFAQPLENRRFDWTTALTWIFGIAALICSTLLILQRRRS
jgi:hypothetical protein